MTTLIIGDYYKFNYTSSSKPSKSVKVKARMTDDTRESLIKFLTGNKVMNAESVSEKMRLSKKIVNAETKEQEGKLKAEFYEKFPRGSTEEKPDFMKAQNLFFRAYNPTNFKEGNDIEAIFGGIDCTVNGKITYKWYVVSETNINQSLLTEEVSNFVDVLA